MKQPKLLEECCALIGTFLHAGVPKGFPSDSFCHNFGRVGIAGVVDFEEKVNILS
jgi:hypothetical protein